MKRAVIAALALAACDRRPSSDQLDEWQAQAQAENKRRLAERPLAAEATDSLAISGAVKTPTTIAWPELVVMATSHVSTIDPQQPTRTTPTDFRGVLVRDLLDKVGASADASEVTFVCRDAFRATVDLADARANRMIVAIEADGAGIPLKRGGPIYLAHPWSESPKEFRDKYSDRFWAFYVTNMIVGTEEPALHVGGKVLDRAALEALPVTPFKGVVGWKVDWPSTPVELEGVALTDVLAAAKVALPPHGHVVVKGRAPLHRDPAHPSGVDVDDVDSCRPVLVYAYGPEHKPIPARLGGPLALAMLPCGDRYDKDPDHHWVTMVDSIEVAP